MQRDALLCSLVAFSLLEKIGRGGGGLMIHSPLALKKKKEKSGDQLAHTTSTFFGQDQSTVVQQAETTVAKCYLTSCV